MLCSRASARGSPTGRSTNKKLSRLPSIDRSDASRMLIGTSARNPRDGGGFPRAESSNCRRPLVEAASTTSVIDPPSWWPITLSSPSSAWRTTAYRRVCPIRTLGEVCGAPRSSSRTISAATARERSNASPGCAAARTAAPGGARAAPAA